MFIVSTLSGVENNKFNGGKGTCHFATVCAASSMKGEDEVQQFLASWETRVRCDEVGNSSVLRPFFISEHREDWVSSTINKERLDTAPIYKITGTSSPEGLDKWFTDNTSGWVKHVVLTLAEAMPLNQLAAAITASLQSQVAAAGLERANFMNSTIARVVGLLHRDVDPDIKSHIEKWHDENPEVTSTVNFKSAPLHSSPIIDYINIGSSWH